MTMHTKKLIHYSCSWACPDCNNFNFTNSFFEDSEIPTDNPFDPLNGNNHNSNKTTTSSNNTITRKPINKRRDHEESWLDPSVKNGEIFPEHFNVFRKDSETSTTGGEVFQISKADLITTHLTNLNTNSESIWRNWNKRNETHSHMHLLSCPTWLSRNSNWRTRSISI